MDRKAHWEHVYQTKSPSEVSWYQPRADLSLRLIRETGAVATDPIIDVGGGASILVDDLLTCGFGQVTVLDVSSAALRAASERLGPRHREVTWVEADVTTAALPTCHYRVWHDRAVFHFLVARDDRRRYVDAVRRSVRLGGHVVIATFALDGPERCSGLEVVRYAPGTLQVEFGEGFQLERSVEETHHTPADKEQKFVYCVLRKL